MNPKYYKFQHIPPSGKWNRLFEGQRILQSFEELKSLDRLEPIIDLTAANLIISNIKAKL